MEINEAAKSAYLSTLSPAKVEEFKKLSPDEQKKKINVFMEQNGLILTKTQPAVKSNKTKHPINMTYNASVGSIGDEVSFSSKNNNTTSIAAQPNNQPITLSGVETELLKVPTYPANMKKRVKLLMRDINEGKEGWYDTAQNIQITIDRINEGSYYVNPQIKDYILHQLEQKLSTFPQDEVAKATNIERRTALQAGRINNQAVIDNLNGVIQGINNEVLKQYDKAGIITHLGEGINADWLGKESSREAYEKKMNEINMRMSKLISLKNQLTTEEFKQKANELLGDILNPDAIVSAFKAGEEANAAMGKTYVIAGTAIAVTGGLAAGAIVGGGAAAAGAGTAGAATAKTAITAGAIVKGAAIGAGTGAVVGGGSSLAADTVDKLTNETDNAEDFSGEELAKMGKNAGTAAVMGAVGGAAGGAITGTLMGTTLSAGAKIGVDIAANTVVGAGIDYVATGEITLEGTLMNAAMSGLGGVSAYKGLKGATNAAASDSAAPVKHAKVDIAEPNTEFFFFSKKKNPKPPKSDIPEIITPKDNGILVKNIEQIDTSRLYDLNGAACKIPSNSVIIIGKPRKAISLNDILVSRPIKDGESITIGLNRTDGNADIKLDVDDKSISRNHFSITREGNDYIINDTSKNGTSVLLPSVIKLSQQSKVVPMDAILEIGNNQKISLKSLQPIKDGDSIIIGRGSSVDIKISNDDLISRKHVKITRHGDSYLVTDISTNGTKVIAPDIITSQPPRPNISEQTQPSQSKQTPPRSKQLDEKLVPSKKALELAQFYRNEIKNYDDIAFLRRKYPNLRNMSDAQIKERFSLDKKHVAYIENVRKKYNDRYEMDKDWLHSKNEKVNPHCAWKMHLFADTAADFRQLGDVVIPYLNKHDIAHKMLPLYKVPEMLATTSPEQAGKAFTIYPRSVEEMAQLAKDLDKLIRTNNLTRQSSKICGDAKLGDSGRLFYRYEYNSKKYKNVILDPKNENFPKIYKMMYDYNRGEGNHLAFDMTSADDIWRDFNPAEPNLRQAKHSYQTQSKSFNIAHKIASSERILDGYKDGGRNAKFDGQGNVISSNREIIVVDRTRDRALNWLISDIKNRSRGLNEYQKLKLLLSYINHYCGGVANKTTEANLYHWEKYNTNKEVLLGDIIANNPSIAVCRHRSLLFKILGDELGLNVELQRGVFISQHGSSGGHAWNVIKMQNGESILCDIMMNTAIPINSNYSFYINQYHSTIRQPLYLNKAI